MFQAGNKKTSICIAHNRQSLLMCRIHQYTHPFNGSLSRTTRVSWYQKGKTSLDFTNVRDNELHWHHVGHMQVCTSLQTDNHTNTPPLRIHQYSEKKVLLAPRSCTVRTISRTTSIILLCLATGIKYSQLLHKHTFSCCLLEHTVSKVTYFLK